MSSSKSLARKQLALEMELEGTETAPCTRCRNAKPKKGEDQPKCILGPRSGKCSECVRKGYTICDVTVSCPEWERLRDSRDKLRRDIEKVEEEEVELLQKLAERRLKKFRVRKQLRLSERRTEIAVAQALDDLEAAELMKEQALSPAEPGVLEVLGCPFTDDTLEMTYMEWEAMDGDILEPWFYDGILEC